MTQPSPISTNTRELTDAERGTTLMSGEDHYAQGERLLAQADTLVGQFAQVHELTTRARAHYAAAQAAAAIWPARPGLSAEGRKELVEIIGCQLAIHPVLALLTLQESAPETESQIHDCAEQIADLALRFLSADDAR